MSYTYRDIGEEKYYSSLVVQRQTKENIRLVKLPGPTFDHNNILSTEYKLIS